MNTIDIIIISTLILIIASIVSYLLLLIVNTIKKRNFSKQYRIGKLPRHIKIKKRKKRGPNHYILEYPYWLYSKKNGTADLRVTDNKIIWENSHLYIDKISLISKRPYDLVNIVKELRLQDFEIDLCDEEKDKYSELDKKKKIFTHNADIQKIIDYYSETPTDFENLCAELFNSMGYTAKVTPKTNDGGYDILLKQNNIKTIVECKCYSIKNKIGRPAIQKLVGANSAVLANKMIFITTSDFSAAAISYADTVGVELINGYCLMKLLREYSFLPQSEDIITMRECQLEISDLYPYVPVDIYEDYFI